jgi:hypothetical protein
MRSRRSFWAQLVNFCRSVLGFGVHETPTQFHLPAAVAAAETVPVAGGLTLRTEIEVLSRSGATSNFHLAARLASVAKCNAPCSRMVTPQRRVAPPQNPRPKAAAAPQPVKLRSPEAWILARRKASPPKPSAKIIDLRAFRTLRNALRSPRRLPLAA